MRIAAMVLTLLIGCNQRSETGAKPVVLGEAASDVAAPGKLELVSAKVRISLGGANANLVISDGMPAVIGEVAWSKRLAVVATRVSDTLLNLHFAAAPEAEALDLTVDQVLSRATIVRSVSAVEPLVLRPGQDVPPDVFGSASPTPVSISWLRDNG